jgi:hypothetical protein
MAVGFVSHAASDKAAACRKRLHGKCAQTLGFFEKVEINIDYQMSRLINYDLAIALVKS